MFSMNESFALHCFNGVVFESACLSSFFEENNRTCTAVAQRHIKPQDGNTHNNKVLREHRLLRNTELPKRLIE